MLYYRGILPPIFLVEDWLKIIQEGNKLLCDDKTIKIFKDNKCIFKYDKKNISDGILIDFKEIK